MAFLIQHKNQTGRVTRILFDLGLRRDLKRYPPPIQKHTENRRPIETSPDVVQNLARGGLTPSDIDYIIFSHVRKTFLQVNGLVANIETTGALGPHR